jgi:xanthine dehydrogenase accessory factor
VERRGKYLAICADCEGTADQIERLAVQMERAGWTANFFFVGETAKDFPGVVRRVAQAGHEVHSHTWSHPNLRRLSFAEQRDQILRGRDAVEKVSERPATGFRAPMHHLNRDTVRVLNDEGFRFDASNLYFRYNMGRVVEFAPTWFREWMPLYDALRVSPKGAFRLFKMLARAARLPILPAHPHYAGRDDRLATAFGDFLLWAREAGYRPARFGELMSLPTADLIPLVGYQSALETRLLEPSRPSVVPKIVPATVAPKRLEVPAIAVATEAPALAPSNGRLPHPAKKQKGAKKKRGGSSERDFAPMTGDARFFGRLSAYLAERQPVVLATVIGTKGSVPRALGSRMMIRPDGIEGTVGGGKFESLVIEEARAMLARGDRRPIAREYPLYEGTPDSFGAICGGTISILIEPLHLGTRLICVGSGHCCRALAKAALLLGWRVEVVEDRADDLTERHFPGVHALIHREDLAASMDDLTLDGGTAVALINRNYLLDRDCLERLLLRRRETPPGNFPFYLGMIGSDRKVKRVWSELGQKGLGPEDFAVVHAPIGLEIEADSPEEIAVSILAEIIRTLRAGDQKETKGAKS